LIEHQERIRRERPRLLNERIQGDTINAATALDIADTLSSGNYRRTDVLLEDVFYHSLVSRWFHRPQLICDASGHIETREATAFGAVIGHAAGPP